MHGYMASERNGRKPGGGVGDSGSLQPGTGFRSGATVYSSETVPANEAEALKKKPQEQTFVLVGAGDIASCKEPEGGTAQPPS